MARIKDMHQVNRSLIIGPLSSEELCRIIPILTTECFSDYACKYFPEYRCDELEDFEIIACDNGDEYRHDYPGKWKLVANATMHVAYDDGWKCDDGYDADYLEIMRHYIADMANIDLSES